MKTKDYIRRVMEENNIRLKRLIEQNKDIKYTDEQMDALKDEILNSLGIPVPVTQQQPIQYTSRDIEDAVTDIISQLSEGG